jgi:hypothetical protein
MSILLAANWIPILICISLPAFHSAAAVPAAEGDEELLKLKLGHGPGKEDEGKVAKDPKKGKGIGAGVDLTLRISTGDHHINANTKNKGKAAENTGPQQLQLMSYHRSTWRRESTAGQGNAKGIERVQQQQQEVNKNIRVDEKAAGEKRNWPSFKKSLKRKMMDDILNDPQQQRKAQTQQTDQRRIISQNQQQMEPAAASGNEVNKKQFECRL